MNIFSKIVSGKISAHIIAEDERFMAFLDINPIAIGHTLIIPKKDNDYIFDMEDDELGSMLIFAKKVAKAMAKIIECKRIGIGVSGFEIPHTHIHLIPINKAADMSPTNPVILQSNEELAILANKINNAFHL